MAEIPKWLRPDAPEFVRRALSESLHQLAYSIYPNYELLTGTAHPQLARNVAGILNRPLYEVCERFPNNEVKTTIRDISVRRKDVFIIQSTCPPDTDAHFMEICQMADAARRSSAANITAVIPHFGYARQDRTNQLRSPVSARLVTDFLVEAGVDRFVTIDIHAEQVQGYAKIPSDNLYASSCLVPVLKKYNLSDAVYTAADESSAKRARVYKELSGSKENIAVVFKYRDRYDGSVDIWDLIGDVSGKKVVLIDDMVDTGGTLIKAAQLLEKRGASEIWATVAHPIMSDTAGNGSFIRLIENSPIRKIIATTTLPPKEGTLNHPQFEYVPIEPLLAEAIRRIATGRSISALFNKTLEQPRRVRAPKIFRVAA